MDWRWSEGEIKVEPLGKSNQAFTKGRCRGAGLGSGAGCGANSVSVTWRCWVGHRVSESAVMGRDMARDRNPMLSACKWYSRSVGASDPLDWGSQSPRTKSSAAVNFGC